MVGGERRAGWRRDGRSARARFDRVGSPFARPATTFSRVSARAAPPIAALAPTLATALATALSLTLLSCTTNPTTPTPQASSDVSGALNTTPVAVDLGTKPGAGGVHSGRTRYLPSVVRPWSQSAVSGGSSARSARARTAVGPVATGASSDSSAGGSGDTVTSGYSGDSGDSHDAGSSTATGIDGRATRRALLAEAIGYGRNATGGLDGPLVRVTTLADDGPGSLREAAGRDGPAWIVFDVDGVIHLRSRLWLTSDKTIDGRGRSIEIRDHGFALRSVENVIITNLRLVRGKRDGVDVSDRSRNVWLHHLTVIGFEDGAIDITRGATDVTVSWCRVADHVKVMLVGADEDHEGDADIRLTLHHTLFEGTGQRHPRIRWGRVHAFNNVVDSWDSFGMAASQHGELRSEHNVFVVGPDSEEAIKSSAGDSAPGRVASIGDLVIGEARIEVREAEAVFDPSLDYTYAQALDAADEALVERLRAGAGWRAGGTRSAP